MEKSKFTLRVDEEKLKEIKIKAIEINMNVNELLILAYDYYISRKFDDCSKNINDM